MTRSNDLDLVHDLNGAWRFRLGDGRERDIVVPGAWEATTGDYLIEGPAVYTRTVSLGPEWSGRRIWLEVDAASFAADVFVNDVWVGAHRGMWSPFQLDVSAPWVAGSNRLRIELWKPGKRHPVREALAGFLPDVCTTFGGIWQSVRLRGAPSEAIGFDGLRWTVARDGSVTASGTLTGPTPVAARLALAVGGRSIEAPLGPDDRAFSLTLTRAIRRWYRPGAPHRSRAVLSVRDFSGGDVARVTKPLGRRWLAADGADLSINGAPASLRGVLDWGWNPETVCPRLTDVAGQFARARALGFNLFKCCLYVPDEDFLEQADAAGMWIWLEMPLWLPAVTPALEALALEEYRAVFERLHHHPCIAVLTLGCELNRATGVAFLRELDALARRYFPGVLIGDNSGSAEAYGGVRTDLGDFIDYHFYADPHFFGPLVTHFDRPYRRARPWLYGEFCDADTLRDFNAVDGAWWLTAPTALDRDDYLAQREHAARFARAGITDGGAALTGVARRQATAVRKHVLERVRRRDATGGYVVTGWRDTPITTSGMVDDALAHKFDSAAWQRFNADRVLCLDRDRRRLWAGGDRPSPREPYTFWAREPLEFHVVLANGGPAVPAARLSWSLTDATGSRLTQGEIPADAVPAGTSREIGVIDVTSPAVLAPQALTLTVRVHDPARTFEPIENDWRLLAVPRPPLPAVVALLGLAAHRAALGALWPATRFVDLADAPEAVPVLADSVTPALGAALATGRRGLLWLTGPDPRLADLRPFWREAIHQFDATHFGLPAHDYADLTAHGIASDQALKVDVEALAAALGVPVHVVARPWRRFDARQFDWRDYWIEATAGPGSFALTTLRLAGGHGEQPAQLTANPLGAWLLARAMSNVPDPAGHSR